jgi:hypothetical protein
MYPQAGLTAVARSRLVRLAVGKPAGSVANRGTRDLSGLVPMSQTLCAGTNRLVQAIIIYGCDNGTCPEQFNRPRPSRHAPAMMPFPVVL